MESKLIPVDGESVEELKFEKVCLESKFTESTNTVCSSDEENMEELEIRKACLESRLVLATRGGQGGEADSTARFGGEIRNPLGARKWQQLPSMPICYSYDSDRQNETKVSKRGSPNQD